MHFFFSSLFLPSSALLTYFTLPTSHVDLYNVYGSCINGNGKMSGAATGFYKAPLGERSLQGPDACIDSIYAR